MGRIIDRLRQSQPTWLVVIVIAVVMVIISVILVNNIQQSTQKTRGLASERSRMLFEGEERRDELQLRLNSVGSDQFIADNATQLNMIHEGSLVFTVLNPEALDKYTAEEYQRYIDEMSVWEE